MLLSFAIIILVGFALQGLFQKAGLPGLLGLLLAGIIIGPYALNLISPDILNISADLRKIALIVIMVRAGLSLDLSDLRRVGRPAVLLGFVPALLEILGATLLGTLLLGLTVIEAALLGAVLAAVSPAIVLPGMLHLLAKSDGQPKRVPQMIMAGATVDNIFVIVVFTAVLGVAEGGSIQPQILLSVPISIISGLIVGALAGFGLARLFKLIHIRDTVKTMLILGLSFLIVGAESMISQYIPFAGILAVVALSATVSQQNENLAHRLAGKFAKVWVAAELVLFILVGALVDVSQLLPGGIIAVVVVLGAVLCRSAGTWIATIRTGLSTGERTFTMIANWPKASLQAVLGALPLAAGLKSGPLILSLAILSIILTAPIGAIGIAKSSDRLLTRPANVDQ